MKIDWVRSIESHVHLKLSHLPVWTPQNLSTMYRKYLGDLLMFQKANTLPNYDIENILNDADFFGVWSGWR